MSKQGVVVGLTGGIASGKSTVSKHLTSLGVCVIDADVIARYIVEPGQPALAEIVEAFGQDMLQQDGQLNRARLGEVVFEDREARGQLNAITHPRIAMEMMMRAQHGFAQGHSWVVYDAALLVENNAHTMFDALIVVAASPNIQFERLCARDDIDEAHAQQRIDSQYPVAQKIAVADYVIDNDGTLAQTLTQTDELYQIITNRVADRGSAKPDSRVWLGPSDGRLSGAQQGATS